MPANNIPTPAMVPMLRPQADGTFSMAQLADAMQDHDHSMRRDRPYNGQPWTDNGERGATEIKGITFRDLRDAFIRAVLSSTGARTISGKNMRPLYEEAQKGEDAVLCGNDLYGWDLDKLDPMAISQNLSCEIEKLMGIFPNLPKNCPTPDDIIADAQKQIEDGPEKPDV